MMTLEKLKTMTGMWGDLTPVEICELFSVPFDESLCFPSWMPLPEAAQLIEMHRIKQG